jgi:MFS family permease
MTAPAHYRRNFVALMGDYVGFATAMAFASQTTVLPDLVSRLTESELAVGLLSSVISGAWLLPQLVYANLITDKRRKKPYVMLGAVIGRPFYLLYALALALGLHRNPALALLLLFAGEILFYGSDALAAVAWFDVMGKAIPAGRRGRLIGSSQLVSGILAIGAGGVIAALLGTHGPGFPHNYAIILALAGVWLLISLFSWSFVVEPDEAVQSERMVWREYVPLLVKTLREDRAFAQVIVVRLLAGCDGLALGFYILFATRKLGLPPETVGLFTAAQTAGRILASVSLGALAERAGSHRVVQVATALGLSAPAAGVALFMSEGGNSSLAVAALAWVFVVIGVTVNANMLGFFNYALERAPAGQRPTYIGLLNTTTGLLVVLPSVGGWLLRTTSYGVLFGLTSVLLILAHLLSLRLPSSQQCAQELQAEPTG